MKLKDLLNENVLGALPSSKLMKMKWNPVTEASAEKGLKTIPAVLSWDIEQFLKKQKDARKLTKGSFTDLVQALHSRGFEDRLNGANLRNWQAVVKKHIKESVNITEGKLNEANPDGTISPDEDRKREKLLKDSMRDIKKITDKIKKEADKIGGEFRSPGIRSQIHQKIRQIVDDLIRN